MQAVNPLLSVDPSIPWHETESEQFTSLKSQGQAYRFVLQLRQVRITLPGNCVFEAVLRFDHVAIIEAIALKGVVVAVAEFDPCATARDGIDVEHQSIPRKCNGLGDHLTAPITSGERHITIAFQKGDADLPADLAVGFVAAFVTSVVNV